MFRQNAWLARIFLAALPVSAMADPLPPGARTPAPQQIMAAYMGKTAIWTENCEGGIYFGPNNQARAWCAQNNTSLGAGKWSVDAYGRMCHELTWYWPNNGRAGRSAGESSCIQHVVDRFDRVWRNYPGQTDWWPVKGDPNLVRGYTFRDEISATQRKLGI
ncbi:DUF995 domain-containing protein [Sulfitobacter sp. S0837]|uniref:DUF995 domain-containing protein n=1 Tax=Sulfitobacter maritimus TaxID=2741719 RepID=UPI001583DCA3|nr:DUF995 domain-containing protein [Sulfitobacter maritimus]NUH63725.1 DUF995 domain-containing protein [Sulfitobacter maritimus]NUH63801.1 DUF995 domain-containing protein [Sulfitobacter maritimus]NUH65572.1 DUF995 domain-containing protein [Sulfitobacter maritimus]